MFNELNTHNAPDTVYIKLSALVDHAPVRVTRIRFQQGKYGVNALLYAPELNANIVMPRWCTRMLKEIVATPEMLKAVMTGHLAIGNIRALSTDNGSTVTFDYMDM